MTRSITRRTSQRNRTRVRRNSDGAGRAGGRNRRRLSDEAIAQELQSLPPTYFTTNIRRSRRMGRRHSICMGRVYHGGASSGSDLGVGVGPGQRSRSRRVGMRSDSESESDSESGCSGSSDEATGGDAQTPQNVNRNVPVPASGALRDGTLYDFFSVQLGDPSPVPVLPPSDAAGGLQGGTGSLPGADSVQTARADVTVVVTDDSSLGPRRGASNADAVADSSLGPRHEARSAGAGDDSGNTQSVTELRAELALLRSRLEQLRRILREGSESMTSVALILLRASRIIGDLDE